MNKQYRITVTIWQDAVSPEFYVAVQRIGLSQDHERLDEALDAVESYVAAVRRREGDVDGPVIGVWTITNVLTGRVVTRDTITID